MTSVSFSPDDETPTEMAALWCIRLADGPLNADEWRQFEGWLAQPGHRELLERASHVWRACDQVADWPEMRNLRVAALQQISSDRANKRAGPRRWLALAASLVLVVAVGAIWYANRPIAYHTGIGERQLAVLPDGSKVTLDSATRLSVEMRNATREVELQEGRARFNVAKDPLRPFTVIAGDKVVVAIGTSFSVELIDGEVRVLLYEGSVEVRDRGDEQPSALATTTRQTLTPGAELVERIGTDKAPVINHPDLTRSQSWEQGLLSFDGEPLASAIRQMNRYSLRKIELQDAALGATLIDGVFAAGDTDAFVEGVTEIHPIRADGNGRVIRLSAAVRK